MFDIGVGLSATRAQVLALPVGTDDPGGSPASWRLPAPLAGEVEQYLAELTDPGAAGSVNALPRPGRQPGHILLVGVGTGDEAGWRAAGAGLTRAASRRFPAVTVRLPEKPDQAITAGRAFAEAAWLAAYRYRLGAETPPKKPLRRVTLIGGDDPEWSEAVRAAVGEARVVADAVAFTRDLVNTPSAQKSPRWFASRIAAAAGRRRGVGVTVLDEAQLAERGFGGILAVGSGSARLPRLVELTWRPRGARTHVALIGKGITFDSGGISIKPRDAMKLMRKDMAGAATACATLLAAADLGLPVRLTAVAPLAENMVSGTAYRPGDVIRHFGGLTTEVLNTDAEGRLVLADALAYAARRIKPDLLVDIATLTGAANVALGKRTAALFSQDEDLVEALVAAGAEVGEPMWPLPLADAYQPHLASDIADLNNAPPGGEAGAIKAALFLREFTGELRDRWVHIDMSAPAWADSPDGLLVRGATGWGVRALLRWLETVSART
ncbi:MAG TPA: leucyl aminopeptidase [Micromonosporaceae bacterium]|nr:leucyl aminopeptidase [Micromonosporaceae bacterium]